MVSLKKKKKEKEKRKKISKEKKFSISQTQESGSINEVWLVWGKRGHPAKGRTDRAFGTSISCGAQAQRLREPRVRGAQDRSAKGSRDLPSRGRAVSDEGPLCTDGVGRRGRGQDHS